MRAIEFSVDLNDPQLADFLASSDPNIVTFSQRAVPPNGFKEQKRRENRADVEQIDAPFLMREIYRLKLKGAPQGTLAAEVFLEQQLQFWVEYVLYLRDGLAADVIERAKRLVDSYDPIAAPDLAAWIADQISDGWLAESDMALLADIHMEKRSSPREVNVAQRNALFSLYGLKSPPVRSRINVLPEGNFPEWAQARAAELELIGTEAVLRSQPQTGREIAEVAVGQRPGENADAEIGTILDDVSRRIIPVECRGDFRREQIRLLSVFEWPEFKIEWVTVSIKVGCARITFRVPKLLIRVSHLIVYIYYHFPKKVDEALFAIAKNCAIRSALTGAVIGIIVGNPAAAIAAFQSFFIDCLRQDAFSCVNPGLFLVKETGSWH